MAHLQPGRGTRVCEAQRSFAMASTAARYWKASARHASLLARNTRSNADMYIIAVDCGRLMCEPIDGVARRRTCGQRRRCSPGYAALKSGRPCRLFRLRKRGPEIVPCRVAHR